VLKVGKVLGQLLEEMKAKHACVGDVRYIGLFSCLELVKNKDTKEAIVPYGKDPEGIMPKIVGMLKAEGFSSYSIENMIHVSPPLIITEEQLREAMKILDKVLDSVDNMIK
jgi:taurine--2-oxoglutarate transaminase